jgi:citrate lyase subunit beta/citryl-CoA lyase
MRSKLFVPGTRQDLFLKVLSGAADAISYDLEDSVAEACKAQARLQLGDFLRGDAARSCGKTLIARVNSLGTLHFEADLLAVAQPGLSMLNLPRPESAADVLAAVAALEHAERRNGVSAPITLLVNIETPKALRYAAEIASAHPRVVGLQLGLVDLFESLNMDRADAASVHAAMFAVRMAAGEAGVFVMDAAFADIQDSDGFLTEARRARAMGYSGKSCIHPSQVPLANGVFRPSDEEIAFSKKVLDMLAQAAPQRAGVFTVDGKMVDAPFIRRARRTLAAAHTLGLTRDE